MPMQVIGFVFQLLAGVLALSLRTHPDETDKYRTHIFVGFSIASSVAIAFFWLGIAQQQKVIKGLGEDIQKGSDKLQKLISAADSFPIMRPVIDNRGHLKRPQDIDGTYQLEIMNAGGSPLSRVTTSLVSPSEQTVFSESVGVIPPYRSELLSNVIQPTFGSVEETEDGHRIVRYTIKTVAQNGDYTEEISFRRNLCDGWDFKLKVIKESQSKPLPNSNFARIDEDQQIFPPAEQPYPWDGEPRCMEHS